MSGILEATIKLITMVMTLVPHQIVTGLATAQLKEIVQ